MNSPLTLSESLSDSLGATNNLETFSLRDLWESIWRHKLLVAALIFVSTACAAIYVKSAPKIYEAQATLLLENNERNIEIESVVTGMQIDTSLVLSEMQVLRSRALMESTLEALNLFETPELLRRPPSAAAVIKQTILGGDSTDEAPTETSQQLSDADRERLITGALSNLELEQIEKSRAITIGYRLHNPELSAYITNELVRQYISSQLDSRYDVIGRTSSYLSDQVAALNEKVKQSEAAVNAYREKNNIVINRGSELIDQDIAELSSKIATARAVLIEAQTRYNDVRNTAEASASPSVMKFPLIQRLREREAEALRELADAQSQYGARHPKFQAAKAQADAARKELEFQVDKQVSGLRREYEVAQSNVSRLEAQLKKLTSEYNNSTNASVELQSLEREAKANRELLEALTARLKETESQVDDRLQDANARLISPATVPTDPVSPKSTIIIIAALIAGSGLGMALAIVLDQLRSGIVSGQQLHGITNAPNIALIPIAQLNKKEDINVLPDYPLQSRYSAYTESMRSISTFINVERQKEGRGNVFNFTSANESEGKTTTVAGVGRQMALEGKKVLVIDVDMRHPALTRLLDQDEKRGLTDCLAATGDTTLGDFIHKDSKTSLHIMPIGTVADADIISRRIDRWNTMLDALKKVYDVIIVDSPPILYVADIRLIARNVNNILCVRWDQTTLTSLECVLNMAADLNCHLSGTVLTMVDIKRNATYNYSDSKYYAKAAKSYYR